MWLMPYSNSTSNVRSASAWLTRPNAAAPKMVTVLSCPVRPKVCLRIIALPPFVLSPLVYHTLTHESAHSITSLGPTALYTPPQQPLHKSHARERHALQPAAHNRHVPAWPRLAPHRST